MGYLGSIPGLGRSPGEGNGNLLSILAWKISWTEEPGGLQSLESQRVEHDLVAKHVYHVYVLPLVSPGLALSYTDPNASSL